MLQAYPLNFDFSSVVDDLVKMSQHCLDEMGSTFPEFEALSDEDHEGDDLSCFDVLPIDEL
jgi:hypothetical protein